MGNMFNSLDEKYKKPFGAVEVGTEVSFNICMDKLSNVDNAKLVIFPIGDWDNRKEIDLNFSKFTDTENYYSCKFTPDKEKAYYYYFKMNVNGEYKEIKRGKFSHGIFGDYYDECFQLTSYTKDMSVPDFMKGAIIYQIFPDRFYKSNTPKNNVFNDRIIHSNWYENPDYLPVNGKILNNDFFGGDLNGITEKLDYLKSLGVSIIYLNPITESHSNHRYDAADYMEIDPMLGDKEDFIRLCAEAKRRGINVILDVAYNHVGSDSKYFNKNNRYPVNGAYNSWDSPYHDWFCFKEFPDKYECWWDFDTLPRLNQNCSEILDFQIQALNMWMNLGVSGFRYDVVDEIGNERFFKLSQTVKKRGCANLGEVWEDISNKEAYGEVKEYVTKNTLDSAMNYPFRGALQQFFETHNSENLLDSLLRMCENIPKDILDSMMNLSSSHDTERIISLLSKGPVLDRDRFWQASNDYLGPYEYNKGKELFKLFSMISYFFVGNPCIYYGDEVGVYGNKDPFNRKTFPWGREDMDLLEFHRTMGEIRNNEEYLRDAKFKPILFEDGVCIFSRESLDNEKSLIVAVNLSDKTIDLDYLKADEVLFSTDEKNTILSPYKGIILKKTKEKILQKV